MTDCGDKGCIKEMIEAPSPIPNKIKKIISRFTN